ncbi:MAG: DUF1573 domain-containing protein [Phycisphaerales bacterium]|jgi:hypothetical protein
MKSFAALLPLSIVTVALVACGEQPDSAPKASSTATPAPAVAPAASTSGTTAPATSSPARPASPPNRVVAGPITAEPGMVDFGLVEPRALVEVSVTLTNSSDQPIEIIASKPTCQCTTVDMTGKVVPARGSITMPVSMQTSAAVGVKQAAVSLLFKGVPTPMQVGLKAEVAYSVVARPVPYIDALDPSRLSGTFDLESPDGKPFEVRAVQGEAPIFMGFDPRSDAPRSRYTLRYDFRGLNANAVPKYLLVETDRADCPLVDLRVRHPATRIAPALKFAEFRSMLGRVPAGGSGEFDLEIEEMGNLRIDTVYALSPDATVELLSQTSDGKNLLVKVKVTPRPGFAGLLQIPVTFVAGGRTAEQLVYGVVGGGAG